MKTKEAKTRNRGVTLIALVVTIIVLLILAGVSIAMLTGDNGILTQAARAKEETEKASIEEQKKLENYESLIKQYEGPVDLPEISDTEEDLYRGNGKIDIQFLKGTTYIPCTEEEANKPMLDEEGKMVPVNWDNNSGKWIVTDEDEWMYSYDTTNKKWANVMLRDTLEIEGMNNSEVQTATIEQMKGKAVTTAGSMLVWIPRYAYKITYYAENDIEKIGDPVGYSDARGLVDKDGKTPKGMNSPVTSIGVNVGTDLYYRPHPAFEDNTSTNSTKEFSQGEWDKKLTGIWIGKFETTEKVNEKITIRPNTAAYVNETIGTFYTEAQNLEIENSHMVKNSEWGAIVYLAESKYGRNGQEIAQNSSNIITGEGAYIENTNQSTTNNIYGIYDLVGGANEYIAGYIGDNSINYGNSFAHDENEIGDNNNKIESTRYATVYQKTTSNILTDNYEQNINKVFGDGIIETSTKGSEITSWHLANSRFVGIVDDRDFPFFLRGGRYAYDNNGLFNFSSNNGSKASGSGFRVCVIVE